MGTRRTFPRHARSKVGSPRRGLGALGLVALAVALPSLAQRPVEAAVAPCQCAFDFEDGTTQGWAVTSGTSISVRVQSSTAYSGTSSLRVTLSRSGSIAVQDPTRLAGVTNGTAVTYRLYSPTDGAVSAQPLVRDRKGAAVLAGATTLRQGWNDLTWQVPFEYGVSAIGVSLTPINGWKGSLALDAVAWPDSFVRRAGTRLSVAGSNYRFDGLNIYNANSSGDCWPDMADNDLLDTALKNLPGLEVFRAWFYQSQATRNGAREWSAFDHTLAVAAARGVKVIVTLADQWGTCDPSGYKTLSWYQGGYRTALGGDLVSYRDFVQQIVTRYSGDPTIAMWQLMNEATATDDSTGLCHESGAFPALRSFVDDVGGLIHSLDPNHLVDLGSQGRGECGLSETEYAYVHASPGTDVCEYHDYGSPTTAMPGDSKNGLQTRISQCAALDKPLFVGESGIEVPSQALTPGLRAIDFQSKFNVQFDAGVVGELLWSWNPTCGRNCQSYDIASADPSAALLQRY